LPAEFVLTVGLGSLAISGSRVPYAQVVLLDEAVENVLTFEIGGGQLAVVKQDSMFRGYSDLVRRRVDDAAGVVYFLRVALRGDVLVFEASLDREIWVEVYRTGKNTHIRWRDGGVFWGLRAIGVNTGTDTIAYCLHAELV